MSPQIDIDGANSKISADTIQGQSGSTVTVASGHNLSGSGSGLTALNATNVTSGTLPMARLSGTLPALNGSALTNLPASSVTTKQISADYNLTTASGTQDITGFGFNPVAMFYMCLVNNSDDWMFGFTDFTNNRTMHTKATTTAVLSATGSMMRIQIGASDNQDGTVAVITDGIRITWTKNGSPTGTLKQYLIGFK